MTRIFKFFAVGGTLPEFLHEESAWQRCLLSPVSSFGLFLCMLTVIAHGARQNISPRFLAQFTEPGRALAVSAPSKNSSLALNTLRSCCVYRVVGRVWGRRGGGWKTSSNFMRNTRRGRLQRPPKPFQSQVHFTFYVDLVVACFEGLANS